MLTCCSIKSLCEQYRIIYQTITPYSPQSNRISNIKKKSYLESNDECNVNK